MQNPNRKKSLCRFYLRGLCILSREDCQFAHGIYDLNYFPMVEGEQVEFDYLKDTQFTQKVAIKGSRIYINLYQYQQEKKYSLQQLNAERLLRVEIRNRMHKEFFFQFMDLLEKTYPQAFFTESFLLREYTRVGFNKLMTRIKFSHLTDTLCQGNNPKYFMKSVILPPLLTQNQNCIFRRASEKEIIECYRDQCNRLLKQSNEPPQEATLKKQLFQTNFQNPHIPPLNLILKEKKTSFTEFLKFLHQQEGPLMEKIRLDPSVEEITQVALKYLSEQSKRLLSWNDLYSYLSKQLKLNNANILNQVRPLLFLEGYYFFYMPMVQFIIKKDIEYPFEKESLHICQCQLKEPYDFSPYEAEFQNNKKQINFEQSVDINDWNSLIAYSGYILGSKIVAIDLEGRLRKGGYVEMVQINNHRNTFLIDFFLLSKNKDHKTIDLAKKVLRNLLVDDKILKIFHDSRHDSLALHQFLDSCIINVFDTSACQTFKRELETYEQPQDELSVNQAKKLIIDCMNLQTPGLNEVLKRYKASHGINKHKERFHRLWREGEQEIFAKRPMDPDYRQYCIRDVLDLPQVYESMMAELPEWTHKIAGWVSAHYVSFGFASCNKSTE